MEVATELKAVLDDKNEPLTKRLKIAQNALNSIELIGINKEEILLEWFSKLGKKSHSQDVWGTLYLCLTSQQLQNFRPNEIRQDTLFKLVNTLSQILKEDLNDVIKISIVDCAIVVLKNNGFKQYFKHNMGLYCTLFSEVLNNITNLSQLICIIEDSSIFNQKMFIKNDCCKHFLTTTLNTLVDVILKYEDKMLIQAISKLIQRCLFHNNVKTFEVYLNNLFENNYTTLEVPDLIMFKLMEMYESDINKARIGFQIIFNAFLSTYKAQNLLIFKFFVTITQAIGFEDTGFSIIKIPNLKIVYNIDKSSMILSKLFESISTTNIVFDTKLNEITFDEYIKNVLKFLLNNRSQLNSSILKILDTTININPLIVDQLITDILSCITISQKNEDLQTLYSNTLLSIFDMYLKLHRIHKFSSEILRTLKTVLNSDNIQNDTQIVNNVSEIMPNNVLKYFQHCITVQSGKQIISIMRTLVTHLDDIVNNLQDYTKDSKKILYAQVVTEMMCQFLSAVRIVEYATTQLTLDKFCKDMQEIKAILSKFGTALLNIEHNQSLMFCFLRISESWGDVIIILKYYTVGPNGNSLKDISSLTDIGDYLACNMTYLHGYLSVEHWSLMTQRIKNFGEKPCQEIMQKLLFQKVRAFIILNKTQKLKENQSTILKKNLLDMENNCNILSTENCTAILLLHEDVEHILNIAEFIVQDLITNSTPILLKQNCVIKNRQLILAILYIWFTKLNSMFKVKRKHNDPLTQKTVTSKVFKCIDANTFVSSKNLEQMLNDISKCFTDNTSETTLKIDENKLLTLLEIPKQLPVCGLSKDVQKIFFMYILAINIDLQKNKVATDCISLCENYLKGIIENPSSPNIISSLPANTLTKILVENVKNFREIITLIYNKAFKCNETIKDLTIAIDFSSDKINDELYLELATKILNAINISSKYKLSEENKEHIRKYKVELCNNLIDRLLSDKHVTAIKLEVYVLLLQYFLQKDCNDNLKKLVDVNEVYVDYCMNNMDSLNSEVGLLLFEILLRNKSKINLSEDFVIKCWTTCQNIKNISDTCLKQLSKTVSLIFEYIPTEEFKIILTNLQTCTVLPLEHQNFDEFKNFLKIWHCLTHSALSTVKQEIFVTSIVKLLEHVIIYLMKNSDKDFDEAVINLQVDVIENKQIIPNGNMIDIYLQTVSILISHDYDFVTSFKLCLAVMDTLVQKRKFLITDRLPSYLINLRILMNKLCSNSSSRADNSNIDKKDMLDCAFQFEKLIRTACYLKRDMARIAPYFISDILKHYEKITFLPGIKNHLDNCLFHLIELCDHHAVSYLFRVLSAASTELFKNIYDNYNKYHKFAGRI